MTLLPLSSSLVVVSLGFAVTQAKRGLAGFDDGRSFRLRDTAANVAQPIIIIAIRGIYARRMRTFFIGIEEG
jgi:hypothetical protein